MTKLLILECYHIPVNKVYVCVYACVYAFIYVCVYVCMYVPPVTTFLYSLITQMALFHLARKTYHTSQRHNAYDIKYISISVL